jgi:quercetin dioxygenase-like cupin family protein
MSEPSSSFKFPEISRIISTHDPQTGYAVFSDMDEKLPGTTKKLGSDAPPPRRMLAYSTSTSPVQGLSPPSSATPEDEANLDLKAYLHNLRSPVPLGGAFGPAGTECYMFELPPGMQSPMHRTVGLDYGVVLDGVIQWELDSGETRILKRGDIFIQRGTAHAFKNITLPEDNGGWLRIFVVTQRIEKIKVEGGTELGLSFEVPRCGETQERSVPLGEEERIGSSDPTRQSAEQITKLRTANI